MQRSMLDSLVHDLQLAVAPQQMGRSLANTRAVANLLELYAQPALPPLHTEGLPNNPGTPPFQVGGTPGEPMHGPFAAPSHAQLDSQLGATPFGGVYGTFKGPDPNEAAARDINIYRTNGDLIFSDWLSSSQTNAAAAQAPTATGFGPAVEFNSLDLDRLYLPIDLGITSFIPLAVGGTDPSVHVFFRAPRSRAYWVPDPAGPGLIPFSTDAELALFTRDPRELTETLWDDSPDDWIGDASTLATVAPVGEIAENSPPFEIPAVVVLPDRWQQAPLPGPHTHPYSSITPVMSSYFGLADEHNTEISAKSWGSAARLPSGTGSIKAIRFLQHGPCDIQQDITRLLNHAKVQLVALLNLCGKSAKGFTFPQFQIHSFVARPYVWRPLPNIPLAKAAAETKSGLEVFGHVTFGPIEAAFKADVFFTVDDGMVVVHVYPQYESAIQNPNAFENPGARLLKDVIDGLLFTGGNTLVDLFGGDVAAGAPWLWKGLPKLLQNMVHDQQVRPGSDTGSVASLIVLGGSPLGDTRCHNPANPTGPMDCTLAATDLLGFVVAGFTRFFGRAPRKFDELPTIINTVMSNAHDLSQPGNWECDPDVSTLALLQSLVTDKSDPNATKQCKFALRVSRATVNIDEIILSPFFDFQDLESSSLMFFFAAYGLGLHQRLCNRFDSANLRQPPDSSVRFFNRWYSGVTINALGCDRHDPALFVKSCKTNKDKGGQFNGFRPFASDDCDGFDCIAGLCRMSAGNTDGKPPCHSNADCPPSESCILKRCLPNKGCEGDWDPFATLTSPFDASPHCPAGQFCNNGGSGDGTCWRI